MMPKIKKNFMSPSKILFHYKFWESQTTSACFKSANLDHQGHREKFLRFSFQGFWRWWSEVATQEVDPLFWWRQSCNFRCRTQRIRSSFEWRQHNSSLMHSISFHSFPWFCFVQIFRFTCILACARQHFCVSKLYTGRISSENWIMQAPITPHRCGTIH